MNIESVLLALRNNCRWNPLMSCYFASSFLRRFLFVMIDEIVTVQGVSYCLRLNITEPRNFAREEGVRHLANKKCHSTVFTVSPCILIH